MDNMAGTDEQPTSAMPSSAIEAVAHAVEAIRTANHAVLHSADFDHSDLYRLVGELDQLLCMVPRLIEQVGHILRILDDHGDIDVDHGNLPGALAVWTDETTGAASDVAVKASAAKLRRLD
jgi:hypothetical protein